MSDNFKFILPAEIEKAKDGEWRVRGLASTGQIDQQGETIIQKGVDLSPIDKQRGILNWDHQKGPENTIGILDGYNRTERGLYIEGRLFKNHSKAKAVREIMESLGDGDRGRMGLSVEGRILERDPSNPAIIRKCQINAVALTMNPVNADTFADIVKSMNAAQEVEFDAQETGIIEATNEEATFTTTQVLAMVQKALSTGAGAMGAPASKTGGDALGQEDLDKKKKKQEELDKCGPEMKVKKMSKSLYKANLNLVLDKLQYLYPDYSRSQIWEAVKDRLDTKFEKAFRIMRQSDPSEREHKLYEDARQRSDYQENKDKSPQELARIAKESGLPASEKAKIKAQNDAAKQVGEKDHVRPFVRS